MKTNIHHAVGLMSGTSMDGTDAVCVRFINHQFDGVIAHSYLPFDEKLRNALLSLQNVGNNELHIAQKLAQKLAENYAQTVQQLFRQPEMVGIPVECVGCHGQTIRHQPDDGYSIQLCDWALLAERLQLPVVGDFRAADIAAGGQGAPLVPAFHQMAFGEDGSTAVVANIGGIANITVLPQDGEVFGFDTGPGNMLMDAWCQKYFQQAFDKNAKIAQTGKTIHPLLSKWLNTEPYFHRKPPKSTGRDLFSMAWVEKNLTGDENPADILRTLTELTARSLANAVLKYAPDCEDLILCGGGAFNPLIRQRLSALLPNASLTDTSAFGLPPMQVEGAAFAWLAHCRLHKIPANLPHATGAKGERILGALWECV